MNNKGYEDSLQVLLGLMERIEKEVEGTESDIYLKTREVAFTYLSEAFKLIDAIRNTPVAHQDAPGSTIKG